MFTTPQRNHSGAMQCHCRAPLRPWLIEPRDCFDDVLFRKLLLAKSLADLAERKDWFTQVLLCFQCKCMLQPPNSYKGQPFILENLTIPFFCLEMSWNQWVRTSSCWVPLASTEALKSGANLRQRLGGRGGSRGGLRRPGSESLQHFTCAGSEGYKFEMDMDATYEKRFLRCLCLGKPYHPGCISKVISKL